MKILKHNIVSDKGTKNGKGIPNRMDEPWQLIDQAERQGFEPWDPCKGVNGFRDRPIRPLWHLSERGVGVGV